jgi:hypothetical protein
MALNASGTESWLVQVHEPEALCQAELAALGAITAVALFHEKLLARQQTPQDGLEFTQDAGAEPCCDDGAGAEAIFHSRDCGRATASRL